MCHRLPKSLADHRCQSNATPIQAVVYRTGNNLKWLCYRGILDVFYINGKNALFHNFPNKIKGKIHLLIKIFLV